MILTYPQAAVLEAKNHFKRDPFNSWNDSRIYEPSRKKLSRAQWDAATRALVQQGLLTRKGTLTNPGRAADIRHRLRNVPERPPALWQQLWLQLFWFMHTKPKRCKVFIDGADELTFKPLVVQDRWGHTLANQVNLGPVYRSPRGKRRSIAFTALNGVDYRGIYYCGSGMYAHVRKVSG